MYIHAYWYVPNEHGNKSVYIYIYINMVEDN